MVFALESYTTNKEYIPRANKYVGQRSAQYLGPSTNTLSEHINSYTYYHQPRNVQTISKTVPPRTNFQVPSEHGLGNRFNQCVLV